MALHLPTPLKNPPAVLYRVECHDQPPGTYNGAYDGFNIISRAPFRPISRQAFHDCLSWAPVATPFMPFASDWNRALRRRRQYIQQGRQNVILFAIWSKDMHNVYDAYDAAVSVGRNPSVHLDEYLVHGGISADEYRVLAVFEGQGEQLNIPIGVPGFQSTTIMPEAFMTNTPSNTAEENLEKLMYEVYQRTGLNCVSKQLLYLIGNMAGVHDIPGHSFVVA
jgi:hypothetical protein